MLPPATSCSRDPAKRAEPSPSKMGRNFLLSPKKRWHALFPEKSHARLVTSWCNHECRLFVGDDDGDDISGKNQKGKCVVVGVVVACWEENKASPPSSGELMAPTCRTGGPKPYLTWRRLGHATGFESEEGDGKWAMDVFFPVWERKIEEKLLGNCVNYCCWFFGKEIIKIH